ncbi:MAG: 3-hexulose-6-phosphate synthase [Candidatus Thermoplasmatota archaeon]
MKPVLQVALDIVNLDRAIRIAKDAVKGGADWIEAGTPLIKSEGMECIRRLKKTFPRNIIVADMKTMDTGALETEMASKAGADVVSILGAADETTIIEAVKSAHRYGSRIMVDFIGLLPDVKRIKRLECIGVDYLCVHVGIDEQMIGRTPLRFLSSLIKKTCLPVAVAGGLNSESAASMAKAGASIIIVGGAIIKAHDVTKAARVIKKAIITKKVIKTDMFKKYSESELYTAFRMVSTPNLSDAMHRGGAMKGIRPIRLGYHMVGRARTVRTIDGDWAKPVEAIDIAEKNEVIVVDTNCGETAVWGELATLSAKKKGLAGVVIDGAVRDIDDIIVIDFPVFSRHISSNAGEPKGFGEIGSEIICGGQTVRNGDWIIGDDSGVVVVPYENAQEIVNRALDIKEQENRIREEIKEGGSLGDVLKLRRWEKIIG